MDRRQFVNMTGTIAAGSWLLRQKASAQHNHHEHMQMNEAPAQVPAPMATSAQPVRGKVITPNGSTLPWKIVKGVKVGHLVAEPIRHTFAPGLEGECWGYNGGTPGPTIEANEGDRVRIYVTNRLPEPTTVHWHGVLLPNGMDGVGGITQPAIPVGETFKYEFTFRHAGTFMYHPHFDEMTQLALGMMGMIVVHPRRESRIDRDFALITHEWKIVPGMRRPDPTAMLDFNVLTFNSKVFPATEPLVVAKGERVRIRLGNLSAMDHHPIHLHGFNFKVTETDGGQIPHSAQYPQTTVLVPVGTTRVIEFVADAPGDWALHCHMTHHMMNQMGHDIPVTTGANAKRIDKPVQKVVPGYMTMGQHGMGGMAEMQMPVPKNSIPMQGGEGAFGYTDMGGMFTLLKVRERNDINTRWYKHPQGTVASRASEEELRRDGIK